ncbi:uncharacterized protein K444DRAFT_616037 [Hyaloscypha bicolor E]|uniref:Uncharacterized protein n=1 Tax=Hyaloscypha bicolor E TaxID=1095630 RepID=A0A2J6SZY1_9HELO|nr:uncharacterized protein K444DRAFT_616037 [Hyaloscypha bicolor E]PMD56233.1 hypothetical protein K444DRAFT_616037 [Hyaloscypha bicolor E]
MLLAHVLSWFRCRSCGLASYGRASTAIPLRPILIHFRLSFHGFPHSDHFTGLTLILPPPRKVRGCPAGPTPSLSALASLNKQQQAQAILAESPKALGAARIPCLGH